MPLEEKEYDFAIIGSGLGGLACAYILASEGYSVVVLEKNHQIGGNLQVFSRDKCIFDTGVHYIGSLDEGENLNQFFKYLGLIDTLKWKRMAEDGFDVISFADGREFKYAQGYDKFIEVLANEFPLEKEAIVNYCEAIKETCLHFPLYNLKIEGGANYLKNEGLLSINAAEHISSFTKDKLLQNVLGATNGLYAGDKSITPWYVHALIINSYLTGSYRLQDGGSQIAIQLSKSIRKMGGQVLKRKEVVNVDYHENGLVKNVNIKNGEKVYAKNFISNVHPVVTIDMFGEKRFLKPYVKRIRGLKNTPSSFIVHIVFKENSFKYMNYNIYQFANTDDAWDVIDYQESNWPKSYFICTPASSKSEEFAESMSVMTYMEYDETKKWKETFNTIAHKGNRGKEYEAFKHKKEERIISLLERKYPEIRSKIKAVYSSTPLTYRDYIGDKTGSLYGIAKDSNSPLKTQITSKTKIKNLSLTGQNLIFHGVLGVTLGAFVTCFEFIDKHKLMEKVRNS